VVRKKKVSAATSRRLNAVTAMRMPTPCGRGSGMAAELVIENS